MKKLVMGEDVIIKYGPAAQKLIDSLKKFDKESFEASALKNIIVGDRAVLEWLYKDLNKGQKIKSQQIPQ